MLAQTSEKTQVIDWDALYTNGRDYWLFEAQFGPIPAEITEMYDISDVDEMNAQLVDDNDYADWLASVNSGINQF